VYSVDDPQWQAFGIPPAHPACRCIPVFLTLASAAARGIRVAQRWLKSGNRPPDSELFVAGRLNESLAARVAAQSDLLTRRAEKRN